MEKKKNRCQLDFVLMDICKLTSKFKCQTPKEQKKNTTLLGFNY